MSLDPLRPRTGFYESCLSPAGLISCKKRYPIGYLFAWKKRETGLEPAASTLARSRSTNWATRAFLIVLCSCWTQDIIYRIIPFLSTLFPQKIKVRNYMFFSENSHILQVIVFQQSQVSLIAAPHFFNHIFCFSFMHKNKPGYIVLRIRACHTYSDSIIFPESVYSTVTDFARFLGLSTSRPFATLT